jgi:maltose alpha-D-glucosyltransferase/alpha-amylase
MQRVIQVRRQHGEAFGVGSLEILSAENPSVLAFLRQFGDCIVLCVNNLSRFAQPVELQLARLSGKVPMELFGRVPFPPIGELPYLLTLGGHGFYWFELVDAQAPVQ